MLTAWILYFHAITGLPLTHALCITQDVVRFIKMRPGYVWKHRSDRVYGQPHCDGQLSACKDQRPTGNWTELSTNNTSNNVPSCLVTHSVRIFLVRQTSKSRLMSRRCCGRRLITRTPRNTVTMAPGWAVATAGINSKVDVCEKAKHHTELF